MGRHESDRPEGVFIEEGRGGGESLESAKEGGVVGGPGGDEGEGVGGEEAATKRERREVSLSEEARASPKVCHPSLGAPRSARREPRVDMDVTHGWVVCKAWLRSLARCRCVADECRRTGGWESGGWSVGWGSERRRGGGRVREGRRRIRGWTREGKLSAPRRT